MTWRLLQTQGAAKILVVLSILVVLAAGLAVGSLLRGIHDTSSDRAAGLHAVAETAIDSCKRNNAQDAGMIILLNASVSARQERNKPLTVKEQKALLRLRKIYNGANCAAVPIVRRAVEDGAISEKEVQNLVKAPLR